MRRVPWAVLLALFVGLGAGLVYSWVISPLHVSNAQPRALRADFKDEYRSVISAAYAATGNLPRAQARLTLLGDSDSIEALNGQAQRMQANGQSFERPDHIVALALALEKITSGESSLNGTFVPTPTLEVTDQAEIIATETPLSPASEVPADLTETPQVIETSTVVIESTPRPTYTSSPVPGEPFVLTGQETVCDPNLPDGLLQVLVLSSNRRQIAGADIVITWDGGKEDFFTGLKPELGNGYADYVMAAGTIYSIQLARGSDVAQGITAPTCQSASGETFLGSIKLTFQQP